MENVNLSDLRVGNVLLKDGKEVVVNGIFCIRPNIDEGAVSTSIRNVSQNDKDVIVGPNLKSITSYTPLTLNAEHLKSLGFTEKHNGVKTFEKDGIIIDCDYNISSSEYQFNVRYLHLLQNVYYLITNQELDLTDLHI